MAIEVKKPQSFNDTYSQWQNEGNAYDTATGGDETTYADNNGNLVNTDYDPVIRFYNWQAAVETYTALVVKMKWKTNDDSGDDQWGAAVSVDGGFTYPYTLVSLGTNRNTSIQTAQVSIPYDTTLSQIYVKILQDQEKNSDVDTLMIYDIWTEGTYSEVTKKEVSDSGSGSDAIGGLNVSLSVSDTGSGVDASPGIVNAFTISDTGAGVDLVAAIVKVLLSDAGAGVDALAQLKGYIPVADTGAGVDAITQIKNYLTVADAGSGVDALSLLVSLTVADSGSGVDAVTVLQKLFKTIQDTGSGVDAIVSVKAYVPVADAGAGVDAISQINVAVPISDTGAGADTVQILAKLTVADVGSGVDAITAIVKVLLADTGAGADSVSVNQIAADTYIIRYKSDASQYMKHTINSHAYLRTVFDTVELYKHDIDSFGGE